jgi:SEC-C motif domain protein
VEELLPTAESPNARFTRLQVLTLRDGGPFQSIGLVEFVALGVNDAGRFRLHELSRFRREDGAWLYIDGVVEES